MISPEAIDKSRLAPYARPNHGRAAWQVANSVLPYLGLWVLMVLSVHQGYSYWITLALAVVASAFLVRIFIIFHDCCHGSFLRSDRANRILGLITGFVTFTPFDDWRWFHRKHHATSGDLDRRGAGDVWMMTVAEYQAASLGRRIYYRIYRFPLFLFGVGPAWMFIAINRIPDRRSGRRGMASVMLTNVAIAVMCLLASATIGLWTFVIIQVPIILISGAAGLWLFFVQHQYEGVYWARHEEWSFMEAAYNGSSYYKLPKVLQWLSGNIGLHHIHHVRPRIPNYRLQACIDEVEEMRGVPPLTIWRSLKSLFMDLWDEQARQMVSFRSLRHRPSI